MKPARSIDGIKHQLDMLTHAAKEDAKKAVRNKMTELENKYLFETFGDAWFELKKFLKGGDNDKG